MLFIVITAVLIAFSYEAPANAGEMTSATVSVAAMAVFVFAIWMAAEAWARWTMRRLTVSPRGGKSPVLHTYQRLRCAHTAALLFGYAGVVHGFDWPGIVQRTWGLERWVLIDDLFVLLPFVAGLLLTWLAQFRVEDQLRLSLESPHLQAPRWQSRWNHIDFHMRHHLGVVFVPLLFLITIQDVVLLVFAESAHRAAIELTAGMVGLALILVFAPLLLRLLWHAEPLPAGPLRARLEHLSRRVSFRSSDILIWNTHGAVINAAVAGILPWPRYVLLSDALLQHLNEDEIEAVFGHEIGHIRHHHLWFFIAFLQGASLFLLLAVTAASQIIASLMGDGAAAHFASLSQGLALPIACLAAYFGIFFGFLSRRFERQADIFGCRAVSCGRSDCPPHHSSHTIVAPVPPLCRTGVQIFVQALEKIAILNGSVRETRSWRHFSIAKRVEFLEQLATRPELERSFHRFILLLKLLVILALAAATAYIWLQSPSVATLLLSL